MKILDVLTSPWAIIPANLAEITEIYSRHLRGEKIDIKAVEAQLGRPLSNESKGYDVVNGVAVLPIEGVMSKKMNLFSQISGGVSMQIASSDLRAARNDPKVTAGIVLVWDTPGGTVDGVQEFAREILAARAGDLPVVSWVDGMMASAGVWAGTAADAVFIGAETDQTGSIGVAMQHVERAAYDQARGIRTTDIYAGKYKRIASENAPLSDEGREYLQSQVDTFYSVFVQAVAAHRGVGVDDVLGSMADGRIFIGSQAIEAGLVDGFATLDELVGKMAAGQYVRLRAGAVSPVPAVVAVAKNAQGAGAAPAEQTPQITTENIQMDQATLEKDHAALFASLRASFSSAGADAERARIKDVLAQSMPGHEALVQTLAFDGTTTGPQAAVAVLAAERKVTTQRGDDIRTDAPTAAPAAASPTGAAPSAAAEDANLSPEQKAANAWDKSPDLRAEFLNDKAAYMAHAKAVAEGRVKVLGPQK